MFEIVYFDGIFVDVPTADIHILTYTRTYVKYLNVKIK